jgi:hypothetical protein
MVMRFFSRANMYGGVAETVADATVARYYAEHLPAIRSQLPLALAELAAHQSAARESLSLHDGQIREIRLDPVQRALSLCLRVGDNGVGYSDLDLFYLGVDAAGLDLPQLEAWASQARAEVLYHEIDIAPSGAFVHRLLLGPL